LSVVASIPVQRKEIRVKDPLSGFFVVRRACIEEVQFQKTGFKLLLEILAKSRAQVVVEVPFQFGRRTADCSKADWRTGLDYAKLLIRLLKRKSEPGSAQVRSQKMEPRQTGQPPALQSILGLLPLVLGFQLIIWIAYLPTALRGRADFRNLYAAGLMIRQGMGHRLYDYDLQKKIENQHISEETALLPYVHLPYEALLFVALSLLSYQKAYVFWLGINLTVLFACFLLLRERLWRLKELWAWCPILFILGFAPITATLMQGQDSIITLLLLGCGLSAISSDKEYLAGLFVGLAAYKFQLVLPIAVLFLLWRRWKFCTGWLVSFVVAIVLSTLVCGWTQLFDYVFSLSRISNGVSSGNQILYIMPVERMPNLRGLIAAISHLRPSISFTVTVVTSAAFLVFAFWVGRNGSRETQFAIAVAAVPLIGFHVLMHDLSILLIPAALLIDGQDSKGFWIIPPIWLAPVLCFFALDYLAAIAVLTFFAVLLLQTRRNLNSPVQAISPIAVRL